MQEELDKKNEMASNYIMQSYGYPYISSVVSIKIPAMTVDILENEKELESIEEDILYELSKFGKIKSLTVPKSNDVISTSTVKKSSIGKAYAEFEEVTSAFVCYNLLNSKPFMGQPVEINFYDRDQYITKSLT